MTMMLAEWADSIFHIILCPIIIRVIIIIMIIIRVIIIIKKLKYITDRLLPSSELS
jgi:hypothetical protein